MGAALMSGCATSDRQRTVAGVRTESVRAQRFETYESQVPFEMQERRSRARHAAMGYGRMSTASRFDSIPGKPRIEVSLGSQQAYFYKGGELVTTSPVSTGKPGFRTPKGSFHISQKKLMHRSNLYGKYVDHSGNVLNGDADTRRDRKPKGSMFVGAMMPYFMRVNGGVGMHQGYVPGYPASHGCIRLPAQMAQLFYENAPVGTPVKVTD